MTLIPQSNKHNAPIETHPLPDDMNNTDRIAHQNLPSNIDLEINLQTQSDEPLFAAMITYLQQGFLPEDNPRLAHLVLYQEDDFFIEDNQLFHLAHIRSKRLNLVQTRWKQLCIPQKLNETVIAFYHNLQHEGFLKNLFTARQAVYFPGMADKFKKYVESCLSCQRNKSFLKHQRLPMSSTEVPELFDRVYIDHHQCPSYKSAEADNESGISTLPFRYVFIIKDGFSQNIELCPARTTSAKESAELLFKYHISRYGLMRTLVSDRHKSFMSELMTSLVKLGIEGRSVFTSGYRAQLNSAETVNKSIIRYLRAYVKPGDDWSKVLPAIACGHRYSVSMTTGLSPFYLLHGKLMRLYDFTPSETSDTPPSAARLHFANELDIIRKIATANTQEVRTQTQQKFNSNKQPHSYKVGQRVLIKIEAVPRDGFSDRKHGPKYSDVYTIVEVRGPLVRVKNFLTSRLISHYVNVDKLRPYVSRYDKPRNFSPHTQSTPDDMTNSSPAVINTLSSERSETPDLEQLAPQDLSNRDIHPVPHPPNDETELKRISFSNTSQPFNSTSDMIREEPLDLSQSHSSSAVHNIEPADQSIGRSTATQNKIIRLAAVKPRKPYAYYKAYFEGERIPRWISAIEIPTQLIIDFQVARHQARQRKKLR